MTYIKVIDSSVSIKKEKIPDVIKTIRKVTENTTFPNSNLDKERVEDRETWKQVVIDCCDAGDVDAVFDFYCFAVEKNENGDITELDYYGCSYENLIKIIEAIKPFADDKSFVQYISGDEDDLEVNTVWLKGEKQSGLLC